MIQDFEIKANTSNTLELGSVKLAYDIMHAENNTIPKTQILLLINGFQRTRSDFRALRKKLTIESPETITVAFDNRFCGETQVSESPENMSLSDFAKDALALLQHCMRIFNIQNVHVLGISMGGMIAQLLANMPECPILKTLFLVSTTAGGEHRVWPSADVLQQKHLDAELSHEVISERLALYFGEKFLKSSPLLFKMFVQNMEKTLRSPNAQDAVRKQGTASNSFEGVQKFSELRSKEVVIISGDEDHILPVENSNMLANLIPNSQLIIYPKIGHLILIENPTEFLQDIVRFLNAKEKTHG